MSKLVSKNKNKQVVVKKPKGLLVLMVVLGIAIIADSVLLVNAIMGYTPDSGNSGNVGNWFTKKTTYVMEAEYIDLSDVSGAGLSDSKSGVAVIYGDGTQAQKDLGWSEGYYVSSSYSTDFQLTFVFTCDKAATGTIVLRLGSEIGNINMSSNDFEVKLNGNAITYSNMYISGAGDLASVVFSDKTLTTEASFVEGENTITLHTLPNSLRGTGGNGSLGGPMIDCIKITTDAKVTFTEHKDNPDQRGAI